jgi:GxxExxY protein
MTPSNEQDPRTDAIIGAAMEVHRQLGCGFSEAVYQEALEIELAGRGIPFRNQEQLLFRYKGQVLQTTYRLDLLCYDSVVVELKALAQLSSTEEAHVINYLKATGCSIGLLLNFGASSVQYKRIILTSKSEGNHSNPNL